MLLVRTNRDGVKTIVNSSIADNVWGEKMEFREFYYGQMASDLCCNEQCETCTSVLQYLPHILISNYDVNFQFNKSLARGQRGKGSL